MTLSNFKKLFKNLITKTLSIVGLVVLASVATFAAPVALASAYSTTAPQWNTGCQTQPSNCNSIEQNWFQVANSTQGTNWSSSVTAKPGDVLSFRVYMHNNTCPANDKAGNTTENCPATIATNVYTHVNLPSTGGTVTAIIGSDQAASNVSSTVIVNLPVGQTVAYKAHSTMATHNKFNIDQFWPMPNNTQVDNEEDGITTGNLGQGDIHGCYSWSRYVVFQTVVSNNVTPTPKVLGTTTSLPNTGPDQAVELLLAGLVPAGMVLRKFRIK